MKITARLALMLLLELSLFAIDHQAPVLYLWRMEQPVFQVIGKVESKRSEERDAPWKRNVVTEATPSSQAPVNTRPDATSMVNIKRLLGPVVGSPRAVGRVSGLGSEPTLEQEKREITLEDILLDNDAQPRVRSSTVDHPRKSEKKRQHKASSSEPAWPAGTYGLPRPRAGCPWSEGFDWQIGYRFHDTEDDSPENQHSNGYHMAGNVSDDGIRHEFCMKTNPIGQDRWPEGKYCIYRKGPNCPEGLEKGFIIWDDENKDNQNSAGGTLPEGHYGEDTRIEFCCSGTGDWDQAIRLPRDRPFYLYAYESNKCQKVEGMRSASEFLKFDDEDRGNVDYEGGEYPYGVHKQDKDHTLFLCYYTPIKKTTESGKHLLEALSRTTAHAHFTPPKASKKKVDKLDEMEKLRNSEKMMDAFLASTAPRTHETDKSERTKTIIKTIRVSERVRDGTASIVATTMGIVLGAVLIGGVVLMIISRRARTRSESPRHNTLEDNTLTYTNSSRRSSFATNATSDDEVELTEGEFEDELVEDQYLPSDSELKSGLELMFLKQQRHYWTRKNQSQ
ncbi:predicted protein [Nematostella vectensis]|uniref:Apextrin C-terminal domain-containing protein n=1 Tax=Nematostella vectensis TaxID=45351 RepID=A7RXW4_NEMVE|nr:predicted protein [Nematostella vectensis]|eukprot:XP_001635757.1 predicted protein [Nematostella vectensis]